MNIPEFTKVQKRIVELNNILFDIRQNDFGVFVDANIKIDKIIDLKLRNNSLSITNNTIDVNLMGDGTDIGKNKKMLNFGFTLLNDTKTKPCSEEGFFSLGMFEIEKECSNTLENSLSSILDDLNNKKTVTLNGNEYAVKFHLGGDLKFIATMMGIGQANSNFPCNWCFYKKDEFKNYNGTISEYNRSKKHTIHDRAKNINDINNRIIKFLEYDDVYVDTLHMLIRISERIIEWIVIYLQQFDYKVSSQSINLRSNNIFEFPSLVVFNDILKECGIKLVIDE